MSADGQVANHNPSPGARRRGAQGVAGGARGAAGSGGVKGGMDQAARSDLTSMKMACDSLMT